MKDKSEREFIGRETEKEEEESAVESVVEQPQGEKKKESALVHRKRRMSVPPLAHLSNTY